MLSDVSKVENELSISVFKPTWIKKILEVVRTFTGLTGQDCVIQLKAPVLSWLLSIVLISLCAYLFLVCVSTSPWMCYREKLTDVVPHLMSQFPRLEYFLHSPAASPWLVFNIIVTCVPQKMQTWEDYSKAVCVECDRWWRSTWNQPVGVWCVPRALWVV